MDSISLAMIGIYFPMGLILLGFAAYMHDDLQKEEDKTMTNSIFILGGIFVRSPFNYLLKSIRLKNKKGIIIASLFFFIFAFTVIIGMIMVFHR